MTTHPTIDEAASGPSRRTTLKRGLAIGGAAVWAIPAVQALSVSAASAEDTSAPPPPPPPPPPSGEYPSHGFVLVNCGDGVFGVKIDSGAPGVLGSLGNGNDVPYLEDQQNLVLGVDYRQPTAADLAEITDFGTTTYNGILALYITLPAGCQFVDGYTYVFDGSFSGGGTNCGDGDKFTRAIVVGQTVYFTTLCNDVSAAPGE
jgi:hypothetical protein